MQNRKKKRNSKMQLSDPKTHLCFSSNKVKPEKGINYPNPTNEHMQNLMPQRFQLLGFDLRSTIA